MTKIGKINCYGRGYATNEWACDHFIGIHRLYHIHMGRGGCRHNGKDYSFLPGHLYYIPFSDDFKPFSDPNDPILHTYVDFERIPPIITENILSADPTGNETLTAATSLFDTGAKVSLSDQGEFGRLCAESILYITSFLAKENGVAEICDEVVLKALTVIHEKMHENISMEEIALECYMNKDSFIRRFKKAIGITPYTYLKNLRLHTARYLRSEGMSYEKIAEKTGYADASSLLHALSNK